jgi:uncharacterized protein
MTIIEEITRKNLFICKLHHGSDLLEELTDICIKNNFSAGRLEAIGAVEKACIGFYDQAGRQYEFITIDQPMEITNLTGNISIKDGKPFVHAHVTLADASGRACGGHLAPGTIVFACECMIETFEGLMMSREFDQETGLFLWSIKK